MSDRERSRHNTTAEATIDLRAPLGEGVEANRLRSLYEIGLELLRQEDPAQVTRTIRDALGRHLNAAHACVLGLGADGSFRPVVTIGMNLDIPFESWPLSHTSLERVRQTGLAMLVTDVQSEPGLGEASSVEAFRIRSILCVPLGRPARGVIYADRRGGKGAFSKADLEFLTAIAVYASLALDRTEAFAQTRRDLAVSDDRVSLLQEELLRHNIVGGSAKLLGAYDEVRRFAKAGARVLLRGETGTGKELFARAYAHTSGRAQAPYVPVPIPSLSPTLVESELFGHVKGAFTEAARDKKGRLEIADGGVLFLDEVGDIAPEVQVKLLRFLDSGELCRVGDTAMRRVDARIVSATNRALEKDISEGRFRADLFARLGQVVTLPPLRERPDDIPVLVAHFLNVYGGAARGVSFSKAALAILQSHDWPFNVRELQQVVERAVCLSDENEIGPSDLPAYLTSVAASPRERVGVDGMDPPATAPLPLREVVENAERAHIERALAFTHGHRRRAAEVLGVSPDTFYRRIRDLGMQLRPGDDD